MPNNTLKNLHKERNPYNIHIYTSVKHSSCSFFRQSKYKRQITKQSDIQSKYGTYAIGIKENSFGHDICTFVYIRSGTTATHFCINKWNNAVVKLQVCITQKKISGNRCTLSMLNNEPSRSI